MAILKRDEILAQVHLRREVVAVPEWGGEVLVAEFSAAQRDQFEQSLLTLSANGAAKTNLSNFRAKLCAAACVDEQGAALFTVEDIEQLGRLSAQALERVATAAMALNALNEADVAELTKN